MQSIHVEVDLWLVMNGFSVYIARENTFQLPVMWLRLCLNERLFSGWSLLCVFENKS